MMHDLQRHDDETVTEFTMRVLKTEWVDQERDRIAQRLRERIKATSIRWADYESGWNDALLFALSVVDA